MSDCTEVACRGVGVLVICLMPIAFVIGGVMVGAIMAEWWRQDIESREKERPHA